jgi:hypothetical protein
MATFGIEFRYSGGMENSDPGESFGGGISNFAINVDKPENLFEYIAEASKTIGATDGETPGTKDYRLFYIKILPGGIGTGTNGKIWMSANDGIASLSYRLAVGTKNTIIAKPANQTIMPSLTFQTAPVSQGSGLALPDVVAGDYVPIGIERSISATNDLQTNKGPSFTVAWD